MLRSYQHLLTPEQPNVKKSQEVHSPAWSIPTIGTAAFARRGCVMGQEFNVLALMKGHEHYIFVYDDDSRQQLVDALRDQAADPMLGLNWFDAAVLIQKSREQAALAVAGAEPEERQRLIAAATPPADPFQRIHRRQEMTEPDLRRVPPSPEEDVLLFIRDHNPFLQEWEKDLLTIVHEEAGYFIPQIETKIMNEGWASLFHKRILDALELPQELQIEFIVRHNQVVRPIPGGLNPYQLGIRTWEDIERRGDRPTPDERETLPPAKTGRDLLFETREVDRDASFLRRWLHERLMRDLDLFRYEPKGEDLVVSEVSDTDGWRTVKETLVKTVGMGSIPVIRIEDADHNHNRTILLSHAHDGRDLQLEYAEKTLAYIHRLWGRDVVLETMVNGKRTFLAYGDRGFSAKAAK